MNSYRIYAGARLLGIVKADSTIQAAWKAEKRWPKHKKIVVKDGAYELESIDLCKPEN